MYFEKSESEPCEAGVWLVKDWDSSIFLGLDSFSEILISLNFLLAKSSVIIILKIGHKDAKKI